MLYGLRQPGTGEGEFTGPDSRAAVRQGVLQAVGDVSLLESSLKSDDPNSSVSQGIWILTCRPVVSELS